MSDAIQASGPENEVPLTSQSAYKVTISTQSDVKSLAHQCAHSSPLPLFINQYLVMTDGWTIRTRVEVHMLTASVILWQVCNCAEVQQFGSSFPFISSRPVPFLDTFTVRCKMELISSLSTRQVFF